MTEKENDQSFKRETVIGNFKVEIYSGRPFNERQINILNEIGTRFFKLESLNEESKNILYYLVTKIPESQLSLLLPVIVDELYNNQMKSLTYLKTFQKFLWIEKIKLINRSHMELKLKNLKKKKANNNLIFDYIKIINHFMFIFIFIIF